MIYFRIQHPRGSYEYQSRGPRPRSNPTVTAAAFIDPFKGLLDLLKGTLVDPFKKEPL